jgi:nitric oxide reductase NorD protein
LLSGERDGDELDLAAVIRARADMASGCSGSERIYRQARNVERDLSVAILIDASLSTDSYVDGRRVLDVEKEAVLALMYGLESCGDDHGVFAFSSKNRTDVTVSLVKGFDEPIGESVRRRLCALRPGYYTRIGAALRHVQTQLQERPTRHRLLLLITDGKPNDVDIYEGRYGIEDTRCAIRDARRAGLAMFGITIDRKARDYFPYLFGPGGYSIVPRIDKLPDVLPAIYRQITA